METLSIVCDLSLILRFWPWHYCQAECQSHHNCHRRSQSAQAVARKPVTIHGTDTLFQDFFVPLRLVFNSFPRVAARCSLVLRGQRPGPGRWICEESECGENFLYG